MLDQLGGIYHGSTLLAASRALHEAAIEIALPDAERETPYRERNLPFLVQRLAARLRALHPPHEAALLRRAADAVDDADDADGLDADADADADAAPEGPGLGAGLAATAGPLLRRVAAELDAFWEEGAALGAEYRLGTVELSALLEAGAEAGAALGEMLRGVRPRPATALSEVAEAVYPRYKRDADETKAALSERDELLARLLALQQAHAAGGEKLYPDANGCLRFSAGLVEGYTAADAVQHTPATTLAGLIDKHAERAIASGGTLAEDDEFACPERLAALCASDPAVRSTPVCLLYSTDTVGGNSGSPVLNADGGLVGINFDRQRLGLMNEFKWSAEYSRSIGVDVRRDRGLHGISAELTDDGGHFSNRCG